MSFSTSGGEKVNINDECYANVINDNTNVTTSSAANRVT